MNVNAGLFIVVIRLAAIALLTPLILVAGLIAIVAVPALLLSRQIGTGLARSRRPALASVMQLETSPAESGTGLLSRRAA